MKANDTSKTPKGIPRVESSPTPKFRSHGISESHHVMLYATAQEPHQQEEIVVQTPMKPIEFLTRSECVQTQMMRVRLDEAIKGLTKPIAYAVVDLDELAASDVRKAYPTPTVLVGSVDIFGMAEPKPPYPEPT